MVLSSVYLAIERSAGSGTQYRIHFELRPSLGSLAVFYKKRPINHKFLETGGDPNALAFPGVLAKDTYRVFQI